MPMPVNEWQLAFGDDPEAQVRMLAEMLRGQERSRQAGQLLNVVGGRYFGGAGQNMAQGAEQQMNMLRQIGMQGLGNRAEMERARMARQSAEEVARMNRESAERIAAMNRAAGIEEARIRAGARGQARGRIVKGERGLMFRENPETGRLEPLLTAEGRQTQNIQRGALPETTATKINGAIGELTNLRNLDRTFRPEFSGAGFVSKGITKGAQILGGLAPTQGLQDNARWWSTFQMLVDLPTRARMFGLTLTKYELAAWDRAQYINAGTAPEQIKKQVHRMTRAWEDALRRRGRSLLADFYEPGAIRELYAGSGIDLNTPRVPEKQRIRELLEEGAAPRDIKGIMQMEGYGTDNPKGPMQIEEIYEPLGGQGEE